MKTNYFNDCKNLNEVKSLYKSLALKYHPDRPGGDNLIMQQINLEYENIKKNPFFKFSDQSEEAKKDYVKFPEIIKQIINFDVVVELCGNWIWLSGNTWKYKKELKRIGFFYAHLKKKWYWRPNDYKSANREPRNMEYIRSKYGSDILDSRKHNELNLGII